MFTFKFVFMFMVNLHEHENGHGNGHGRGDGRGHEIGYGYGVSKIWISNIVKKYNGYPIYRSSSVRYLYYGYESDCHKVPFIQTVHTPPANAALL
jgi:hypothetical protein